ncbi:MAG: 7-cyano-7-deazaguanine synthase [Methanolobus sp.]|uniref:7-cyano-7-deazaguanine synthase n=1 Tax=Methanolobus tindarius DSM 2278 TaxID=1090322 RepID=W9DMZ2_METTI|nr:queuosine biosynthesis protein QueC [Methanolobus tindarius DSM 2278]MDK2831908.1 7-cyano-7-deazaguanine synthase [Methanolobus sp.]
MLSSGLDSVTSVAAVLEKTDIKMALIFNYGQRAVDREIQNSIKVCEHFGLDYRVLDITWMQEITNTSLVNTNTDVPKLSMEEISDEADPSITVESAKAVWVPNRNGILINIAAAYAESMDCEHVVVGFNKEEAVTFPDNSPEFISAIDDSLSYSTQNDVKVLAPLIGMNKKEIVARAIELKAPLEYSWSCYHGADVPCGECESCTRRRRAFEAAGVKDPLLVRLGKE